MLLSACSSGGTTSAAGESGEEESSSEDTVEVEYVSPLGDFLGWSQSLDFDEEAEEARWAEQQRQVQEAIAVCMSEQGFEYIPVDTSAQNAFFEEQLEDELDYGSAEWTAKYGFGVTTQRFTQGQVGPDLVANPYNFDTNVDSPADPNQDYIDSLGPNEQEAYFGALYGNEQGVEWDDSLSEEENQAAIDDYYENEYVPTGCEPVAWEEVTESGPGGEAQFRAFEEEFGNALEEMEERMTSHPDVVAYRAEVRACVEERGVEYLDQEEAWEFFENELTAAGLGWEDAGDPFADLDTTDFTDEDFERVWQEAQNQPLAPEKLEALGELQALEIATAVALEECGGGWQNEEAALQSVRIELEEEFLAANADRLAEFEGVFGN